MLISSGVDSNNVIRAAAPIAWFAVWRASCPVRGLRAPVAPPRGGSGCGDWSGCTEREQALLAPSVLRTAGGSRQLLATL